eukprot:Ihof_evm7s16 gene=Ihof_evmTU7s16
MAGEGINDTDTEIVAINQGLEFFPDLHHRVDLMTLTLRSNAIKVVPKTIGCLPQLTRLDLSDNLISSLPSEAKRLTELQRLDLSKNLLETFPPCITILRNLRFLNISDNNITSMPGDIGSLCSLVELNCSKNKIERIPLSIGLCSQLKKLDFSENKVACVPKELDGNPIVFPSSSVILGGVDVLMLFLKTQLATSDPPTITRPQPSTSSEEPVRPTLRQLKVTIVTGTGINVSLPVVGLSRGFYCELTAGGATQQQFRTPVIPKSPTPVFNVSFTIVVGDGTRVTLALFARKVPFGKDFCMGVTEIGAFHAGQEEERVLPLRALMASGQTQGSLTVRVALAGNNGTHLTDTTLSSNVSTNVSSSIAAYAATATAANTRSSAPASPSQTPTPPITTPRFQHRTSLAGGRALPTTAGLPFGWERKVDSEGRTFYVDHGNRATSWDPPPMSSTPNSPSTSEANPLPPGWEERRDGQGRVYYVDHNTRSTTWHRPTRNHIEALDQWTSRDLGSAQRLFQQRTLTGHHSHALTSPSRSAIAASPSTTSITSSLQSPLPSHPPQPTRLQGDFSHIPLPAGWEQRRTPSGEVYFLDHSNRRTQWTDPRSQAGQMSLPRGWSQSQTSEGRVYFVDHNTRRTTFQDPRLNPAYMAAIQQTEQEDSPQYVRDFNLKAAQLKAQLAIIAPHQGECRLILSRDTLFADSFEQVMAAQPSTLQRRIMCTFKGEDGLDYGGLSREWFFLLSHEMLNPNYCLFEYANQNRTNLQINSNSGINPEHLLYFQFIGRVVAMAVFHGKFLDCGFTLPFYKRVLGRTLTLDDVEAVDPEYFTSLKWILENKIDGLELGIYFSSDYEMFGEIKTQDLKPNGSKIEVTDENKEEYISLITQWRFSRGIEEQMKAFIQGFDAIVPVQLLSVFDEKELEILICGVTEIDVDAWEKNTVYRNYTPNTKQIRWFWQCVRSFDNEMRIRLLQFVTGTCRVPMGGFKELQGNNSSQLFCIEKSGDNESLPRSHT